MSGKNGDKNCVAGVFCSRSIDEQEEEYVEFKIPAKEDSFLFYYEDNYTLHFDAYNEYDNNFGSFFEEDGTILLFNIGGLERLIISYSEYESSTLGFSLSDMTPIETENLPSSIPSSFMF